MKKTKLAIPVIALLFCSCALLQPGADPTVVNAERTTALAADVFDTLLKFEYTNRDQLKAVAPEIHTYAEVIRRNGTQWLQTARAVTVTYKTNRTPENKASLATAIAVLQTAVSETQKYIAQAQLKGLTTP